MSAMPPTYATVADDLIPCDGESMYDFCRRGLEDTSSNGKSRTSGWRAADRFEFRCAWHYLRLGADGLGSLVARVCRQWNCADCAEQLLVPAATERLLADRLTTRTLISGKQRASINQQLRRTNTAAVLFPRADDTIVVWSRGDGLMDVSVLVADLHRFAIAKMAGARWKVGTVGLPPLRLRQTITGKSAETVVDDCPYAFKRGLPTTVVRAALEEHAEKVPPNRWALPEPESLGWWGLRGDAGMHRSCDRDDRIDADRLYRAIHKAA